MSSSRSPERELCLPIVDVGYVSNAAVTDQQRGGWLGGINDCNGAETVDSASVGD